MNVQQWKDPKPWSFPTEPHVGWTELQRVPQHVSLQSECSQQRSLTSVQLPGNHASHCWRTNGSSFEYNNLWISAANSEKNSNWNHLIYPFFMICFDLLGSFLSTSYLAGVFFIFFKLWFIAVSWTCNFPAGTNVAQQMEKSTFDVFNVQLFPKYYYYPEVTVLKSIKNTKLWVLKPCITSHCWFIWNLTQE